MRTGIAIVLALVGLTACAGGNCPRGTAGNAGTGGGEGVARVEDQGPAEHAAPTAELAFEDHTVTASPSDAPPDHLTAEEVHHIVSGQISDVHQCYENALVSHPQLTGRVVVRIHIHHSGNVVGAEASESTLGPDGAGVAECIVEHIDDWHFPEATHDVAVTYPFLRPPSGG